MKHKTYNTQTCLGLSCLSFGSSFWHMVYTATSFALILSPTIHPSYLQNQKWKMKAKQILAFFQAETCILLPWDPYQSNSQCASQLVSAGPVVWTKKDHNQTTGYSCMLFRIKNCQNPSTTRPITIGCSQFLKNPHILSLFWRETAQKCMRYGQNDMLQQNPTLCNVL